MEHVGEGGRKYEIDFNHSDRLHKGKHKGINSIAADVLPVVLQHYKIIRY